MKLTAVVQTNSLERFQQQKRKKLRHSPTLNFFWKGGGVEKTKKRRGWGQSKRTKETLSEEKEEIKPKIS